MYGSYLGPNLNNSTVKKENLLDNWRNLNTDCMFDIKELLLFRCDNDIVDFF